MVARLADNILFEAVHNVLHGEPRRAGKQDEFHAQCPYCGKEAKPNQNHFSYSMTAHYCFVCGNGGGLWSLAQHLGVLPDRERQNGRAYVPECPPERPGATERRAKPQQVVTDAYLAQIAAHEDRYVAWWAYRGINANMVDRCRLGMGKLPGEKWAHMEDALILPVFYHGECVVLRARTKDRQNGKGIIKGRWFTHVKPETIAKALYAPLGIPEGIGTVYVFENCANAILWSQNVEDAVGVAMTTGAASFEAQWPKWILQKRPGRVVVAGDDDSAGRAMIERWVNAFRVHGFLDAWGMLLTEAKEMEIRNLEQGAM